MLARTRRAASYLDLDDDDLRALTAQAWLTAVPRNKFVFSKGETTNSIYVIHSGRVKELLYGKNGREFGICVLGAGEFFGEMALDEGPRAVSVRALEPTLLFMVPQAAFTEYLAGHSQFALRVIKTLLARQRALLGQVEALASLNVYGRLARLLLELATEEEGTLVIKDRLTTEEIANRVAASREQIHRILRDLAVGGYIHLENKRITIKKNLPTRW